MHNPCFLTQNLMIPLPGLMLLLKNPSKKKLRESIFLKRIKCYGLKGISGQNDFMLSVKMISYCRPGVKFLVLWLSFVPFLLVRVGKNKQEIKLSSNHFNLKFILTYHKNRLKTLQAVYKVWEANSPFQSFLQIIFKIHI